MTVGSEAHLRTWQAEYHLRRSALVCGRALQPRACPAALERSKGCPNKTWRTNTRTRRSCCHHVYYFTRACWATCARTVQALVEARRTAFRVQLLA